MKKLKIALLWHFHQPYYEFENEFLLPWVRLHGVKDYWDLPEVFHEFPNVKHNVNLVPSLSMQIEDYINGTQQDKIQRLTKINASEMTHENKADILNLFFVCNEDNMIRPYPRFNELFEKSKRNNAINDFNERDWRDLQVWYNLTWFGQKSRQHSVIQRLFKKGRDFTEIEKKLVLDYQIDTLSKIKRQITELVNLGQVEISCTPLNHPILPLLCNSKSALESMPDCRMPENIFSYPEDAKYQIEEALNYYDNLTGIKPQGMWPSEGSLSNEVLGLMIESGVGWTASDEEVLKNSLREKYNPMMKYFPVTYNSDTGKIKLFFRDHNLSDKIGFVYSNWNAFDAASDFINNLRNIRNNLINTFGEDVLDSAVVPIILDGENCWEFYYENGIHFQRELFKQLEESQELITAKFSECQNDNRYFDDISHIQAGSWINANFKIWIGHDEEKKAWSMLSTVRKLVEEKRETLSDEDYSEAMKEIYIAEGSDWFWWYGDEHNAPNKPDFDVLFRWHLKNIYNIIGIESPEYLDYPIGSKEFKPALFQQSESFEDIDITQSKSSDLWSKSACFDAAVAMSSMHQVGEIFEKLRFISSKTQLNFRFELSKELAESDSIKIKILSPIAVAIDIKEDSFRVSSNSSFNNLSSSFKNKAIEFSIPKSIFETNQDELKLTVKTQSEVKEIVYPRQGEIVFKVI